MRSYAPVAVLGQTVADTLFPDGDDPLGQYVVLNNVLFQVIGVMARARRLAAWARTRTTWCSCR